MSNAGGILPFFFCCCLVAAALLWLAVLAFVVQPQKASLKMPAPRGPNLGEKADIFTTLFDKQHFNSPKLGVAPVGRSKTRGGASFAASSFHFTPPPLVSRLLQKMSLATGHVKVLPYLTKRTNAFRNCPHFFLQISHGYACGLFSSKGLLQAKWDNVIK